MRAPPFLAPYVTQHACSLFLDALSSMEPKFFGRLFDSGFSGGAKGNGGEQVGEGVVFPKRSIDRPLAQILSDISVASLMDGKFPLHYTEH